MQAVAIPGPQPSAVPEARQAAYSDFRMSQIKIVAFLSVMGRSPGLAQLLVSERCPQQRLSRASCRRVGGGAGGRRAGAAHRKSCAGAASARRSLAGWSWPLRCLFWNVDELPPCFHPVQAPHKDAICSALMRLLESAPDSLTHRKEVLVAAKNLLNTPFRCGGILGASYGNQVL